MAGRLEPREPRWRKGKQNPPTRRQDGAKAFRKTLTEDQLHRSVAEYLGWVLRLPAFWTTFPAGWGALGPATAGRLKASGLKDGVPDLMILYDGRAYFIELKIPGKKPSNAQYDTQLDLMWAGCPCDTAHSIEEVAELLRFWKIPVHAHAIQVADKIAETRQQAQFAQGPAQGQ